MADETYVSDTKCKWRSPNRFIIRSDCVERQQRIIWSYGFNHKTYIANVCKWLKQAVCKTVPYRFIRSNRIIGIVGNYFIIILPFVL